MNAAFPKDPQLTFFTDFTEDCAERRAQEILETKGKGKGKGSGGGKAA